MTTFRNRYRVESTRLADWDYASRGWYFVTLCTQDRECSLGRATEGQIVLSNAGVIAESEIKSISSHYENVIIDRYVVMPNHVHAIVVIDGDHIYSPVGRIPEAVAHVCQQETGQAPSLQNIVGNYKAGVSRICHARGISGFAWQARVHDHILRCNASVNAIRDYIDHNPENWLLDPDNAAAEPRNFL
jgi:REP-associated tyrosine transposase